MKYFGAILASAAVVGVIGVTRMDNGERYLRIKGGRSTISFFPSILKSNGLSLKVNPTAENDMTSGEASSGFAIAFSDLQFTLKNGALTRFDGGEISHKGGFTLISKKGNLSANGFTVAPTRTATNTLEFKIGTGKAAITAFEFQNPRPIYRIKDEELTIGQMDVLLTPAGAQQLGRPELAGTLVATMNIFGDSEITDGGGEIKVDGPPEAGPNAAIDVSLSAMSSLTSIGRLGTFPTGRNGLSMSTTSCNVGTSNIPWAAPMQVAHPVIAMNLYRINNGRLEQIGWSWLKHGFFATNSSGCGSCQNPGTGSLLGPNCSDTYGTGNNSDRNYLGGRDEVNPFTGVWTCQNSYFSNYVNDCTRRNNGSEFGSDPVAHRLEVADADLNVAGSQFFYEAYYINANDFDKYNNVGSRQATASWSGSSWNFSTITAQVQGPVINQWGEMRSTATPNNEGDVIVAVQTTNLGGGVYHYEYAVYNHDLDRQVREFSVPVPAGATVTNIGFRDIDQNATNQWTSARTGNKITWSTGTFGVGTPNPLKYSSLFNFRFDCNVAPVNSKSTLGLFKPGTGTQLTAATKAPLTLDPVSSFAVENGVQFSGTLASLHQSDEDRLEVGPTFTGTRSGTGISTSMTAPTGVTSLIVGVESKNSLPTTANPVQVIRLWNWTLNDWEQIDSRAATNVDSQVVIPITSNVSRFIQASSREVRMLVLHSSPAGSSDQRWRMHLDQVGIQFN
ncbi:MAG: hypothetical protein ABL949_00900 [Fimbriimonadaceae bacterium]